MFGKVIGKFSKFLGAVEWFWMCDFYGFRGPLWHNKIKAQVWCCRAAVGRIRHMCRHISAEISTLNHYCEVQGQQYDRGILTFFHRSSLVLKGQKSVSCAKKWFRIFNTFFKHHMWCVLQPFYNTCGFLPMTWVWRDLGPKTDTCMPIGKYIWNRR